MLGINEDTIDVAVATRLRIRQRKQLSTQLINDISLDDFMSFADDYLSSKYEDKIQSFLETHTFSSEAKKKSFRNSLLNISYEAKGFAYIFLAILRPHMRKTLNKKIEVELCIKREAYESDLEYYKRALSLFTLRTEEQTLRSLDNIKLITARAELELQN